MLLALALTTALKFIIASLSRTLTCGRVGADVEVGGCPKNAVDPVLVPLLALVLVLILVLVRWRVRVLECITSFAVPPPTREGSFSRLSSVLRQPSHRTRRLKVVGGKTRHALRRTSYLLLSRTEKTIIDPVALAGARELQVQVRNCGMLHCVRKRGPRATTLLIANHCICKLRHTNLTRKSHPSLSTRAVFLACAISLSLIDPLLELALQFFESKLMTTDTC